MSFCQPQSAGISVDHLLTVARKQAYVFYSQVMQLLDGFRGVFFKQVSQPKCTGVKTIDGADHHRRRPSYDSVGRHLHTSAFQKSRTADKHAVTVNRSLDAVA